MPRFHGRLHVLCEEAKWAEVKQLVLRVLQPEEHDPEETEEWDKAVLRSELMRVEGPHDWTPLMISCVRAPIDIIALLCHANPRACLIADKSGSLPVHFCCTFRRGPFCEVLLNVLCESSPMSLEVQNAWGQTPLHSLLDAKQLAPIGCLRVLLDQGQYTQQALKIRDHQQLLPLHIAAKKALTAEHYHGLVEPYREASCLTDKKGNLPCHLLHQTGQASAEAMETLLIPLALGTSKLRKKSAFSNQIRATETPKTWSQLVSLTKQAQALAREEDLGEARKKEPATPPPLTSAQQACRTPGFQMKFLPIHLAAHYGVKLEILKGICRQYPEGAKMYKSFERRPDHTDADEEVQKSKMLQHTVEDPWEEESLNTFSEDSTAQTEATTAVKTQTSSVQYKLLSALEIFESGKALEELQRVFASDADEKKKKEARAYYDRRADLLLGYHLEAKKSTGEMFIDDAVRLARMERRVAQEAKDTCHSPTTQLSDAAARLWYYFCTSGGFIRNIGRVVSKLAPPALWKLTVVPLLDRDVFCLIKATGRTVAQEAEMRAISTKMDTMLRHFWFQRLLATYLSPEDALNYSATCTKARAAGVRLLPQVPLWISDCSWEKPANGTPNDPPKPFQRLDAMVVPDCTHTIFLTYYIDCKVTDDTEEEQQEEEEQVDAPQKTFGGLLVVQEDRKRTRPNDAAPWGDAVVASQDFFPLSGSLVTLRFPHVPGRTYGIWYFSRGVAGSKLIIGDLRVRQLLHSCDAQGKSPLHLLLNKFAGLKDVQAHNTMQVSMLLAAKFGSRGNTVGDAPIHYALKCGVSGEILGQIIDANRGALVETCKGGRTPIHEALILARDAPPSISILKSLLVPPGENAIRLKDATGRLPIHIAAERGAGEDILRLLVDAYVDGCYRTNRDGDLPIHLHLRSGAATQATVEMLIEPIIQNETICKIGGSRGFNLPLHIAAEYLVNFEMLEKLLKTYGDAALEPRQWPHEENRPQRESEYALEIFERRRPRSSRKSHSDDALSKAKQDVEDADFSLRSDLIFVYNPLLINKATGAPFRSDRERIRRLENMIRREASQVGEDRKINRKASLSDMGRQAWVFLTTYSNPENPSDNFAGTVRRILRGLPANAVDVLAHTEHPKSVPTPNMMIKDSATSVCQLLIMSRLRFVGRYVLYDELHPVHKSESCLVMRARDHGLEDDYKRFMSIYDAKENTVEDDISDAGSEPPEPIDLNQPHEVTLEAFLKFTSRLGVPRESAKAEISDLLVLDNERTQAETAHSHVTVMSPYSSQDEASVESEKPDDDEITVGKEALTSFCQAYGLDEKGIRTVVIKFMKKASQFKREKEVRGPLNLTGTSWPVVPILDAYNVDRIEASRRKSIKDMSKEDGMSEDAISGAPENGDELYALDIQEKNASVHNFALYKYAVVMPAGDRDLGEISQHEELGVLQIRDYMLQIGNALKCMHDHSVIHGDLRMENVVRFGKNLSLIDFDGAHWINSKNRGNKMGGGSSKFCTGVLPPEMISRLDLISDFPSLNKYEDYWRHVSEDAKDINLLTPDDIQTISSVVRSLLVKADISKSHRKLSRTLRDEMKEVKVYDGSEERSDWKDALSLSLMTISFEDLPFSLNRCEHIDDFAKVWNRLLFHTKLWNKVKPRITQDERCAYLIKTYDDLPDEYGNVQSTGRSVLPYDLVTPSEKIDVWGFGALMFALCSGGQLFHLGFGGDLRDCGDFSQLFEWDRAKAERIVREKVEDPLAQDLLRKILAPVDTRIPTMDGVLQHPFFGPSSSLEAQHILERHEEEQLIIEETVVIKRMTTETRRRVERSMERQCKLIFAEDKIVVPTCLVVLPYQLQRKGENLGVSSEKDIGIAIELGHYLLEINKITAQLSFFLMVKRSIGNRNQTQIFRSKMKQWVKRSKTEGVERVTKDILKEVGCGREYSGICFELLNEGEGYVKNFLNDPMGTAREGISEAVDALIQCYDMGQYLYLVDEMNGVPVRSEEANVDDYGADVLVYPIPLDASSDIFNSLLLLYMNLAVMKLTAAEGLPALAKLLGMPPTFSTPSSWKSGKAGLVHRPDKPSSIAEFAILHEVMRKQRLGGNNGTLGSRGSTVTASDIATGGNEMARLEDFFRNYDPVRTFADLHRVSDGRDGSTAIWTTESEVNRIQGELELASVEYKLRELKREWLKKQKMQEEIQELTAKVKMLKGESPSKSIQNGSSAHSYGSQESSYESSSRSRRQNQSHESENGSALPNSFSVPDHGRRQESSLAGPLNVDRRSSSYQSDGFRPADGRSSGKETGDSQSMSSPQQGGLERQSSKRKKMRIRPYFGVC